MPSKRKVQEAMEIVCIPYSPFSHLQIHVGYFVVKLIAFDFMKNSQLPKLFFGMASPTTSMNSAFKIHSIRKWILKNQYK